MTTAVAICNLALAKLGDVAKVTSITDLTSTGDQSMQAYYCAQFYGQALAVMLDSHPWTFAISTAGLSTLDGTFTRSGTTLTGSITNHGLQVGRSYNFKFSDSTFDANGYGTSYGIQTASDANTFTLTVANSGSTSGTISQKNPFWTYAYGLPSDFYGIIDLTQNGFSAQNQSPVVADYAFEGNVLYTDLQSAILVYTSSLSTTPALFPPLFVEALSVLVAAYLAGPILKGDVGVTAGQKMMDAFTMAMKNAKESDLQYRKTRPLMTPSFIAARSGFNNYTNSQGFAQLNPLIGSNNVA